jgi:hypothetical protein
MEKHLQESGCDCKSPEFRNLQETEEKELDPPRRTNRMNESGDCSELEEKRSLC